MREYIYNTETDRDKRILSEAWDIIREAVRKGYEPEARKRICKILNVSEEDANDIISQIKSEIAVEQAEINRTKHSTKSNLTPKNIQKPTLTTCSACGHQISIKTESCPSCGNPTGVHVCPNCQSINTKVISGASKAGSIFLWGVFAANKVVSKFECKDCGHKW